MTGWSVILLVSLIFSTNAKYIRTDIETYELLRADDNPCDGQPNGSFQRHPLGCKYFILCNNGNVNTGVCPNGLAYNPAKPPCDLAANVGCNDQITTTTSTTTTTTPVPTTTTSTTTHIPTTTSTTPPPPTTTTEPPTTTTTTEPPTTTTTTTTEPPTTTTTTAPPTTTTTSTTTTLAPTTTTTTPRPTPRPTLPNTTRRPTATLPTLSPIDPTETPPIMSPIEPLITCPITEDPRKIIFLSSNKECSKYYICYHNAPVMMSCAPNLHWNIKTNQCDTRENAKCTVSTMPSFYPVCPRETVGLYPHPFNCELFLYCFHGHMTVQQCPFYYHWDIDKESCVLKNIANCASIRQ